MKFLNELLNEHKAVKGGVDIGDGFRVMKVGRDVNGNTSYWVSRNGGRAKKIQAVGNIEGDKVFDIRDFANSSTDSIKHQIKEYYYTYLMKITTL